MQRSRWVPGPLALSANEAPFIAETLRSGVFGVEAGQVLAGQALGMIRSVSSKSPTKRSPLDASRLSLVH